MAADFTSERQMIACETSVALAAPQAEQDGEGMCYCALLNVLHPAGLACPRCRSSRNLRVHRRHREPVIDYQCGECGRVFNAWTGTALQKTHRRPSQLVQLLRGMLQGTSTAQLARDLGCQRSQLLALRRRLQQQFPWLCREPQAPDVFRVATPLPPGPILIFGMGD